MLRLSVPEAVARFAGQGPESDGIVVSVRGHLAAVRFCSRAVLVALYDRASGVQVQVRVGVGASGRMVSALSCGL